MNTHYENGKQYRLVYCKTDEEKVEALTSGRPFYRAEFDKDLGLYKYYFKLD